MQHSCSLNPDPLQGKKEGMVNIVHPHTMGWLLRWIPLAEVASVGL